ncbi:cytochrome P450 4V2 [Trichonephila clavipes]|nr:cytochrome P450 4V2 [Trichonephila clavipes]
MEKWKPRRKLLSPCFHTDILREYLTVFNECSRNLVEYLRQETMKEFTYISRPLVLTSMDIIFETILGATIGALENNKSQYADAFHRLLDIYMTRVLKFWEWSDFIFDMTSGRETRRLTKLINDFIKSEIKEKMKEYLSGNKDDRRKRKTFMNLLLELHFETQELSEEDLCNEVKTHISAGYETVSDTMTWALYLIGLYPDVQEKIHEELDRIFGSDVDRCVTENDLNELKYLDCVLKAFETIFAPDPHNFEAPKSDLLPSSL